MKINICFNVKDSAEAEKILNYVLKEFSASSVNKVTKQKE